MRRVLRTDGGPCRWAAQRSRAWGRPQGGLRHCASGASSDVHAGVEAGGGRGSTAAALDKKLALAQKLWRRCIEGEGVKRPPQRGLFASFHESLCRRLAIYHVKSVAPAAREEGRFDSIYEDLAEGGPQCIRYLASCIGADSGAGPPTKGLTPPLVEEALADRLKEILTTLHEGGCKWKWEVDEDEIEAQVTSMFVIIGGSRSGHHRRGKTDLLSAFGQQLVLTREQTKIFLDRQSGLGGRMPVIQELLLSDLVLVADVMLTVPQRSVLVDGTDAVDNTQSSADPLADADASANVAASTGSPDSTSGASTATVEAEAASEIGETRLVEHVLRLEMPLKQERNYRDDDLPTVRAEAWQIVDWNKICNGNHPSLPRGIRAPW